MMVFASHCFVIVFGNCCFHLSGQRELSTEQCSLEVVVELETPGAGVVMLPPGKLFHSSEYGEQKGKSLPLLSL